MSLTSYRAAPPRVTMFTALHLLRHGDPIQDTSVQDGLLSNPAPV
jgi:hypothetical protein